MAGRITRGGLTTRVIQRVITSSCVVLLLVWRSQEVSRIETPSTFNAPIHEGMRCLVLILWQHLPIIHRLNLVGYLEMWEGILLTMFRGFQPHWGIDLILVVSTISMITCNYPSHPKLKNFAGYIEGSDLLVIAFPRLVEQPIPRSSDMELCQ